MNLETALNEFTIDKDHVYQEWIQWAVEDESKLLEVVDKAFGGSERERERANWILHHVSDRDSNVFRPLVERMRGQLTLAQTAAEERFILRYFSMYYLPKDEEFESYMLDYCFSKMLEVSKEQAPRIYSMSIVFRLVERYPELAHELDETIGIMVENANPGIRSRGKKIREEMQKKGMI
jgi:hypothetical protein